MKKITFRSGNYRSLIAAGLGVGIIAGALAVGYVISHNSTQNSQTESKNPGVAIVHSFRHHRLSDAPTCAPSAGQVSSTVSMELSEADSNFSQSCYYAPAGQSFTIDFTNPVVGAADNSPTTVTLVISQSGDPAFAPDPSQPGVIVGSTAGAAYVGVATTAPNTTAMTVPALSAGTYDLQLLGDLTAIATLVVQ